MTNGGQVVSNAGQVFAPYVSRQKEVGLKYDGGNIGASASFFTTSMPSAYVQNNVYGVFGKQRNRGLEFNVFGEPVKGLRVLGGLTLLDAQYLSTASGTNDGKRVVGVPRSQANIGADWDVPGVRGLALNARLMYTGAQYANAGNTQRVPAWSRFDLGARYLMDVGGKLVSLNARVDNVANRNYWAGRRLRHQRLSGPGRAAYLLADRQRGLLMRALWIVVHRWVGLFRGLPGHDRSDGSSALVGS
jgi:iron complex outermembrane receptor protein